MPNISLSAASSHSHNIVKKLFSDSKELSKIQKELADMELGLVNEWEMVVEGLCESNTDEACIAALKYQSDLEHYFKLNSAMVQL